MTTGYLYLTYPALNNKTMRDSSKVNASGAFSFKGEIAHPVSAFLTIYGQPVSVDDLNFTSFFISPGNMTIRLEKDKFKKLQVTGSPVQNEMVELEKVKANIEKRLKPLSDAYSKEKDPEKAAVLREKMEPFFEEFKKADYDFFNKHPSSFVTAYLLQFYTSDLSIEEMEKYYEGFIAVVKESKYGIILKEEIEKLKGGSPGAVAKDFSRVGIDSELVRLSFFRQEKYILLDFWASWCVPCRKGNPHMKEVYLKYKDKGFEIIGVSDDDNRPESWKKAVKEDGLPWLHVLRGLDWEKIRNGEKNETDINEKYGIHTLPTKILIDKNGIIIGRYKWDEDDKLDKKLDEIFKQT